jgi:hypothetical protein
MDASPFQETSVDASGIAVISSVRILDESTAQFKA